MRRIILTAIAGIAAATPAAAQKSYSVGTNPQGSGAYSTAAAISKVVLEDKNISLRVVPQGGPVVTLPMVNSGELDFSIAVSTVAAFAHGGTAMFKGRPQDKVRIVAVLFPLRVAYFVKKDSDIKTLADLKGKRVATKFTKQKINEVFGAAILAMVGLSYDDVVGSPVPSGNRGVEDFMSGRVDATQFSMGAGVVAQADASVGGIRFLSVPNTPESLAAMRKISPGTIITTVQPSPRFPGVVGPTATLTSPFLMTATSAMPDDLVYQIVASLYANKEKLVASHKAFGDFEGKDMHADLGMPYHPGALKFYKEKGI